MASLEQRALYIESKLIQVGECLIYPSLRRAYLTVSGTQQLVYRILWEARKGPIPRCMNVLHKCDNKHCCNLDHLELGGQRRNLLDAVERGLIASTTGIPGISFQKKRKRYQVMPTSGGQSTLLYVGKDLFEAVCRLRSWESKEGHVRSDSHPAPAAD